MTIFLDTNIVLDLLSKREPHYTNVADLYEVCYQNGHIICCSSLTIANTAYTLVKYVPKNKIIHTLSKFVSVCKITTVDEEIIKSALNSDFKDFEDGIQYYSALKAGADIIITRDTKGFAPSKITVKNSSEVFDN